MTDDVKAREAIASMILQLLDRRAAGASICPSEVARALAPDDWRALMTPVRTVAAHLAIAGTIRITQGRAAVDPHGVLNDVVRGPLRIRREP